MQSPPRREDHRGVDLISNVLPFSVRHYFFNSISSGWLGVLPVISTVCVSASRQTTWPGLVVTVFVFPPEDVNLSVLPVSQ